MQTPKLYKNLRMLMICLIIFFSFVSITKLNVEANSYDQTQASASQSGNITSEKLEVNKLVEKEIKARESHSYIIEAKVNDYLNLVVEQKGVDVVVRLFSPEGEKLQQVDLLDETQGEELLQYVIDKSGNYRIEIVSLENTHADKYSVLIKELRIATARDKDIVEAINLTNDAEVLRQKGRYEQALPICIRAVELRKKLLGNEHLDTARSLNSLALIYKEKAQYKEAEPLFIQALEIRKKLLGENHSATAQFINNLAELYRNKKDYEKAEALHIQALEIRKKALGERHAAVAQSMNSLGSLYKDKGDFSKAEAFYTQALEIRKKALGENHFGIAQSLNNLAELYRLKNEYEKAEAFYIQALEIGKKTLEENHPTLITIKSNLATVYMNKGDYKKAEPIFIQTLEARKKLLGENHYLTAQSMSNLAIIYRNKGAFSTAEALSTQAVEIYKKTLGETHIDTISAINNLVLIYYHQGQYDKGLSLCLRVLEKSESFLKESRYYVAIFKNSLALLYSTKGEYEKAEPLYIESLEMHKKILGENHPTTITCMNNLAALYRRKREYEKAEPLFIQTLEARKKIIGENNSAVAQSISNLAQVYYGKGEYEKAEALYIKVVEMRVKLLGEEHPTTIYSRNNLAILYREKGEYEKAVKLRREVNEARESDLVRNLSLGSEDSRQSYLQKSAIETDQTISLHIQTLPKNQEAAQLALTQILRRKGRALDAINQSMEVLRKRSKAEDIALLDELAQKKTLLSKFLTQNLGELLSEEDKNKIKNLKDEVERLEYKISQISAEFRSQSQTITLDAVQSAIPQNATLIEFASYRPFDSDTKQLMSPHYVAYTLNRERKIEWADLGDASKLDKLVEDFRQTLIKQPKKPLSSIKKELKPKARELDKIVLAPLRKLLGKSKRLLIAPDGNLNLLPFDSLVDEQGKYLVENYEISYLTSGRDLLRLENGIKNEQKTTIIADPDYGQGPGTKIGELIVGGERLKYTALEANEIQQILKLKPQEVLLQTQATKAALKNLRRPEILHIATHGFFLKEQEGSSDSRRTKIKSGSVQLETVETEIEEAIQENEEIFDLNPLLKSGLLLAGANKGDSDNGVLTALEATSLDLWGTKLVVLSACDTGIGEIKSGDGVYGLRRALVLAGSETQLMSLWPISDSGTRDLMIKYYQALEKGEGRSSGLRKVRLELLKSPKLKHPYFWASFIQSGEWANLKGKR